MILVVPFLVVTNMNIYCIIMLEMLLQFYYKRRKNKKDAGHVKKKVLQFNSYMSKLKR